VQPALRWSFQEGDASRVDAALRALLDDTGAQRALLIDRTGRLIAGAGLQPDVDLTTFASLAAADFAANDQLASLLGEGDFSSLAHQGARESVLLAGVAGHAILAVLFDRSVTLGMIRIRVRRLLPALAELMHEVFSREAPQGSPQVEAGWGSDAESEIDRLFDGW
jgi:predicted regulator of Ras-like GTPase activity (Roadblock/LC7/MglB family)